MIRSFHLLLWCNPLWFFVSHHSRNYIQRDCQLLFWLFQHYSYTFMHIQLYTTRLSTFILALPTLFIYIYAYIIIYNEAVNFYFASYNTIHIHFLFSSMLHCAVSYSTYLPSIWEILCYCVWKPGLVQLLLWISCRCSTWWDWLHLINSYRI